MRAWLRGRRVLRRASGPVSRGLALAVAFALGMRVGAETRAARVQIVSPDLVEAIAPMTGAVAEAGEAPASGTAPVAPDAQPAPVTEAHASGAEGSPADAPCSPGQAPQAAGPVDLNRATAEQLEALPGIGPVLARRIVEFRSRYGPFRQVDDLVEVTGVGPKTLQRLKGWVTVQLEP